MKEAKARIEDVQAFWNTEACGTHFIESYIDSRDFYDKFREHRYRTEWHLPLLVPFAEAGGKKVLEIGTGNGADGAMFALEGAHYTGVDLTPTALEATRRHFELMGLAGNFRAEDAEHLSFCDESFDWVYSHGVLHHTPHPAAAVHEVWRVLRPGGRAIVMLYYKQRFNYWVRIMLWMRARVLLHILMRAGRWSSDKAAAADFPIGLRGNEDRKVWEIHYRNFLKQGWSYLRATNFVHHCTDGPECPVAYVFSRADARRLFSRFARVEMKVAHLPLRKYSRWFPFRLEKFLAPKIGWYLFVYAWK